MAYTDDDRRKYLERMQKADNIQKAGTEMMKMGCAITVLAFFAIVFVIVVIGALAS
jgi:hypothetical protein